VLAFLRTSFELELTCEQRELTVSSRSITNPATSADADDQVLVDLRYAAKLLSVSSRTVQTLVSKQGLPHVRIGRRLLFRPEALRTWAASREHDSPAEAPDQQEDDHRPPCDTCLKANFRKVGNNGYPNQA